MKQPRKANLILKCAILASALFAALVPVSAGRADGSPLGVEAPAIRHGIARTPAPEHFRRNLALGQPATASNEEQGSPASMAVDGDLNTIWNAGSWPPQWIEIDLGEAQTVSEIDLVVSQFPDSVTDHLVWGKANEGDPYTLLHEFNGFTVDAQVLRYALPQDEQLRYVKIETTASSSWVAWREVEVYGPGNMTFLDNGTVRVGVDLDLGGVITHVSPTGGGDDENLVNEHDTGREVQQSYYSDALGSAEPCPGYGAEWNPVGAGDCNGNHSTVLAYTNDGSTIYTKSRPLLWPFDDVPCECTFEQWVTLSGDAVLVRNRLVNNTSDRTQYVARWQELPAFYTIGRLGHLYSYTGAAPYSNAALTEITDPQLFHATEHWAANVDDAHVGLGIVSPDVVSFFGAFSGTRGTGGSFDDSTGYIAPTRPEILDWNVSYEYRYALVMGTLDEIRAYAVAHRPDPRPDYHFNTDRQGWWYWNATDTGAPIVGSLEVKPSAEDPQMYGPEGIWAAQDAPKLYIRAAYHTTQSRAQLFWRSPWEDFSEERALQFDIDNDGKFHTYALDLAAVPTYAGMIGALRLDPVFDAEAGGTVDFDYISFKPDQRTLSVTVDGHGSVTSTPAGIQCPGTCTATFADGTEVRLQADYARGSAFEGWSGDCDSDAALCDLAIDGGGASATATFVPGLHRRSVTLSFTRRLATGRVRVADGFAQCRHSVRVRLERRVGRRWKLAAAGRTKATGHYAVRVSGHGAYRVSLSRRTITNGHVCTAARSRVRKR